VQWWVLLPLGYSLTLFGLFVESAETKMEYPLGWHNIRTICKAHSFTKHPIMSQGNWTEQPDSLYKSTS